MCYCFEMQTPPVSCANTVYKRQDVVVDVIAVNCMCKLSVGRILKSKLENIPKKGKILKYLCI